MTMPFTAASTATTRTKSGKSVMERVSDRKAQTQDKIKTGDILDKYKNARKGM